MGAFNNTANAYGTGLPTYHGYNMWRNVDLTIVKSSNFLTYPILRMYPVSN